MPVKFIKVYTEELLDSKPDEFFVFGDNYERKGKGGQAKVCRDKANAIGLPTKKAPNNLPGSYLSDEDFGEWLGHVADSMSEIITLLKLDRTVNFPEDGLGTGLAKLPERAPKILNHINEFIGTLVQNYGLTK